MNIPKEKVIPDEGSSLKLYHHVVTSKSFLWNYHEHPEVELVYVKNGRGRRHVGKHISYYENGDLVLIGSSLPHAGFGYGTVGIHEEIVVQFKAENLFGTFETAVEYHKILTLIKNAQQGISFHGSSFKSCAKEIEKLPEIDGIARTLKFIEILHILSMSEEFTVLNPSNNAFSYNFKDQERMKIIFDFVEKSYHLNVNSREVASLCSLTHPAFCNYFKLTIGENFTSFLNKYRIKKAKEFLRQGNTVSNVTDKCGFNSLSYFSRLFKRLEGVSPKDFL